MLPVLGQVVVGVGLLGVAARLLGGRRRWRARRAAIRGLYGAGQPLPIDATGYQPGLAAAGPIHTVALT
ncbi:MAG: hypothetical protein EOO59_21805 [Hymenobacter sp.]|nr:MAG: hypothetical protein EOO59_21805 [Hymenobacter sp.]